MKPIKKILSVIALLVVLSMPAFAGDMGQPGIIEPPKCTENCPSSSNSQTASTVPTDEVEDALPLEILISSAINLFAYLN